MSEQSKSVMLSILLIYGIEYALMIHPTQLALGG